MPKVAKQSPTAKLASRPADSSTEATGVKLLVYGQSKTGKTRLACTFSKPALLIGTEDGTKSVSTSKRKKGVLECGAVLYELLVGGKPTGVDFVRIEQTEWMDELVPLVSENYKTGILDHAGGFQDLLLKEVLGLEDVPVQKSWGLTDRQTWGVVGMQFKERMSKLLSLADRHGVHVPLIAHERAFNDEGGGDVISPTVGAALTPSAAGWLNGACDYICQCFKRAQVVEKEMTVGDSVQKVQARTGKIEYCLRVGPHEVYTTGFRVPIGVEVPDLIVNPTYDKIQAVIDGTYKIK